MRDNVPSSNGRQAAEEAGVLNPLPFLPSLLYLGLPALLMAAGFALIPVIAAVLDWVG